MLMYKYNFRRKWNNSQIIWSCKCWECFVGFFCKEGDLSPHILIFSVHRVESKWWAHFEAWKFHLLIACSWQREVFDLDSEVFLHRQNCHVSSQTELFRSHVSSCQPAEQLCHCKIFFSLLTPPDMQQDFLPRQKSRYQWNQWEGQDENAKGNKKKGKHEDSDSLLLFRSV